MESKSKKGSKLLRHSDSETKPASCFCWFPKVKPTDCNSSSAPVYLNVYDLTPMNGYLYWAGLGVFHSGVEVHGVEYAFGAHEHPTSGVFEVEPHSCPGFKFRRSIFIGTTSLDAIQVRQFMERHSLKYNGDTYHLIAKNCNHFCYDVCYLLTGKLVPRWVNRLARIGAKCSCILPEALKTSVVKHDPDCENEKQSLRPALSCLSSVSMRQKSSMLLQSPLKSCLPLLGT